MPSGNESLTTPCLFASNASKYWQRQNPAACPNDAIMTTDGCHCNDAVMMTDGCHGNDAAMMTDGYYCNRARTLAEAEERRAALVRELEALDANIGGLRCAGAYLISSMPCVIMPVLTYTQRLGVQCMRSMPCACPHSKSCGC